MRRIIGFACFVLSSLIIIAIVAVNIEIFENFLSDLEGDTLVAAVGIYAGILWEMLYQPLVILLLSVIAMGNYARK